MHMLTDTTEVKEAPEEEVEGVELLERLEAVEGVLRGCDYTHFEDFLRSTFIHLR